MKLVALAVALLCLSVLFALLERAAASVPRQSIFRRERLTDFLWWFFTPTVGKIAAALGLAMAVGGVTIAVRATGRDVPSPAWFRSQHVALQIIELLVAADLLAYVSHRLFHRGVLWRFHSVHHSSTQLDWLAAARVHPLNEVLSRIFQIVPLYLLGFRGDALAALVPVLTFYAIFVHANLRWDFGPLRYLIASPVFHRWHHTSQEEGLDRNFAGLFPWIDVLFGTFYMPRDRQPERFGLAGEVMPSTLMGQLAHPFRSPRVALK